MNEQLAALMQLIAQRRTLELSLVEIDSDISSVQSMIAAKEHVIDSLVAADNSLKNAEMRRLAKTDRLFNDDSYQNLSSRLEQLKQQKAKTKIDIEECRSLYQVGLARVRWETAELERRNIENSVSF